MHPQSLWHNSDKLSSLWTVTQGARASIVQETSGLVKIGISLDPGPC